MHETSLYTVLPKQSQPAAKHCVLSAKLSDESWQLVQLPPWVHDKTTVTRSLTSVLHASVTWANLPFRIVWRDALLGRYADWFDTSRSRLKGPVSGE